jgi:heat shock protein HslJ
LFATKDILIYNIANKEKSVYKLILLINMNKKNVYVTIVVLIIILAGFLYFKNMKNNQDVNIGTTPEGEEVVIKDIKSSDLDKNTADPVLTGKQWSWIETYYNEGNRIVNPVDPKMFVLSFIKGDKFSTTTDCNKFIGKYILAEKNLTMSDIASTKMACEDPYAQEQTYISMLANAESYFFRDDGKLVIMIKNNKGSITFSPVTK